MILFFRPMNTYNLHPNSDNQVGTRDFSYLSRIGGYFLVVDDRGKVEFFSSNLANALGLNQFSCVGKNFFELIDTPYQARVKQKFQRVNDKPSFVDAFRFKMGSKKRYFDAIVTQDKADPGILKYILNLHDITKRIEEADHLISQNNELDSFIYKVSHDLKAPLKSIEGLVHLSAVNEVNKNEYLSLINNGVSQLQNYITQLSMNVRENDTKVEKICADKFVTDLVRELQYSPLAQHMTFNINIHNDTPIYTDSFALSSILRNLISNAIKYQNRCIEKSKVNIDVKTKEERYSISVEDNGIGIKTDQLDSIFKMFHRSTCTSTGSGIGLAIAMEAAKKINGDLNVSSTFGQGTTFELNAKNFTCTEILK